MLSDSEGRLGNRDLLNPQVASSLAEGAAGDHNRLRQGPLRGRRGAGTGLRPGIRAGGRPRAGCAGEVRAGASEWADAARASRRASQTVPPGHLPPGAART
jgi:hypothetical protein